MLVDHGANHEAWTSKDQYPDLPEFAPSFWAEHEEMELLMLLTGDAAEILHQLR